METSTLILRFVLAFIAASLFGIERQRSHKPIGFGTFTFVTLGAFGLTIVAVELGITSSLSLLSAIITGIGFLGAGALIKGNDKVFGATTAASIWLFAILGVIIGLGYFFIGIIIYSGLWIVILIDKYLQKKGIGTYQRRITIKTDKIIKEDEIKACFSPYKIHYKKTNTEIDRERNKLSITYVIEGAKNNLNKVAAALLEKDWLDSCKIE